MEKYSGTIPDEEGRDAEWYRKNGFSRVDVVHLSEVEGGVYNDREKEILRRINALRKQGMEIREIRGTDDLDAKMEGTEGKKVAIGGGVRDVCCSIRSWFIRQAGGKPVIDDSLTTDY